MRDVSTENSIALWLKKSCGSETSAKQYLSTIQMFFSHVEMEPDKLIQVWKQVKYDLRQREQFLDEWTEKIEAYVFNKCENHTPLTKRNITSTVKSFFKHHRIEVTPEYLKRGYVVYHNRSIKKEEIKRILEHSVLRDRCFFLMMAESGLRPDTLVQLRYEHIKEDFEENRTPMKIDLPSKLLKDRVSARWTFIGKDAFKVLKEYLKVRLPLQDRDLIFKPRSTRTKYDVVTPSSFTNIFRRTCMKLGIAGVAERRKPKPLRLYCLRKYFRNNLRADRDFMEFWMCHKTTQTHYVSKDIERHREEYAQAYGNLRIYHVTEKEATQTLRSEYEERIAVLEDRIALLMAMFKGYDRMRERKDGIEGLVATYERVLQERKNREKKEED